MIKDIINNNNMKDLNNNKLRFNEDYEKQYICWNNMMKRCYNKASLKERPTYKGCSVCEEWHNFQSFAKWYNKNYYKIDNDIMCLDKDILYKENKVYSPETCVFVLQDINKLFTKRQNKRGKYPIGVKYKKINKNYETRCNNGDNKSVYLGVYKTPKKAFKII